MVLKISYQIDPLEIECFYPIQLQWPLVPNVFVNLREECIENIWFSQNLKDRIRIKSMKNNVDAFPFGKEDRVKKKMYK